MHTSWWHPALGCRKAGCATPLLTVISLLHALHVLRFHQQLGRVPRDLVSWSVRPGF